MTINKSKSVYKGKIINLELENVTLPNGDVCDMEIVYHPGGASIVALNEHNQICILRQYRHALRDWLWELPAGKIEPDHEALETAKRELTEEAGLTAVRWHSLGVMYPSPGVMAENIYLFLARDLEVCKQDLEHGEVLEVHWLDINTAMRRVLNGEINDAKSCVGIMRAVNELDKTKT